MARLRRHTNIVNRVAVIMLKAMMVQQFIITIIMKAEIMQ